MPARRQSPKLRALGGRGSPDDEVRDARIGGVGLDWAEVPPVLDEQGRAEWSRLAGVYEGQPTRFREGDRPALIAFCAFYSAFVAAAADVAERGPVVMGRSAKDRDRAVKNPATVAMREAAVQLRFWARELGLTPDSRGRIGVDDADDGGLTGAQAHAARFLS